MQQLDCRPPSGQGSAQSLPKLKHRRCQHLEDDVLLQIKVTRLNRSQMDLLFLSQQGLDTPAAALTDARRANLRQLHTPVCCFCTTRTAKPGGKLHLLLKSQQRNFKLNLSALYPHGLKFVYLMKTYPKKKHFISERITKLLKTFKRP